MASDFLKKRTRSSQEKKTEFNNSRLYVFMAIIFFMFVSLVLRLVRLQIIDHEEYLARAEQQQHDYRELQAERGLIFLREKGELYPIALNQDYASLYLNPRLLSEAEMVDIIQVLYTLFHQAEVEAEVDKLLEDEFQADLKKELDFLNSLALPEEEKIRRRDETIKWKNNLKFDPEWIELQALRRELEIKERQENIIHDYLIRVNVPDKYSRLLKRKLSREELLDFFFLNLKDDFSLDSVERLSLKNGKIYLDDERNLSSEIKGLHFSWETFRYYPEKEIFSNVLGFTNLDNQGNYGLEGFFDYELRGQDGFLLADKGSYQGKKLIIDKREYQAPVHGQNLVLTIDYAVQLNVCQKLKEAQLKHNFESGSVIVLEPQSGRIIAMCLWPGFDPNNFQAVEDSKFFDNQAISYQYEPGSVFKPITMAMAINEGKVGPNTYYEDKGQINIKGWPKPLSNSDYSVRGAHGWVNMNYVLENSLNTGTVFAANQIGAEVFRDYLRKFGFGERSGLELSSESPGNIDNLLARRVKDIDLATASFGQGIAVTPLQMISAFAVLANQGVLMKPYLVEEILDDNYNLVKKIEPQAVRSVVSKETAETVSAMLVNVVEKGHAKRSQIEGYYIGGKTGTAQIPAPNGGYLKNRYIHNFIGYAPINNPRFVLLVKFDQPQTSVFAEGTVVPVFGEIVDFLLKYYQIPKERK